MFNRKSLLLFVMIVDQANWSSISEAREPVVFLLEETSPVELPWPWRFQFTCLNNRLCIPYSCTLSSVRIDDLKEQQPEIRIRYDDSTEQLSYGTLLKEDRYFVLSSDDRCQIVAKNNSLTVTFDEVAKLEALAVSQSGELVALANNLNDVFVYNHLGKRICRFYSDRPYGRLRPHTCLSFAAKDVLISLTCADKSMRVLNIKQGDILRSVEIPCAKNEVLLGCCSCSGCDLVIAYSTNGIFGYSLPNLDRKFSIPLDSGAICTCLSISPDGKIVIAAFMSRHSLFEIIRHKSKLCAYSAQTGRLLGSCFIDLGSDEKIHSVCFGKESDHFIAANSKRIMRFKLKISHY